MSKEEELEAENPGVSLFVLSLEASIIYHLYSMADHRFKILAKLNKLFQNEDPECRDFYHRFDYRLGKLAKAPEKEEDRTN